MSSTADTTTHGPQAIRRPSAIGASGSGDSPRSLKRAPTELSLPKATKGARDEHFQVKARKKSGYQLDGRDHPSSSTDRGHLHSTGAVGRCAQGTSLPANGGAASAAHSEPNKPSISSKSTPTSTIISSQHALGNFSGLKPSSSARTDPSTLYPGPSTTEPRSDHGVGFSTQRQVQQDQLRKPENFMYAGNTFSNLDEQAFHDIAKKNPYLAQLTVDAVRPVYKSSVQARQAIKEGSSSSRCTGDAINFSCTTAPDFDETISKLNQAIDLFRGEYENNRRRSIENGIEVGSDLWDRVLKRPSLPPKLSHFMAKGAAMDIDGYLEQMQAWDKSIEQQIFIRRCIVYEKAIAELQRRSESTRVKRDKHGQDSKHEKKIG